MKKTTIFVLSLSFVFALGFTSCTVDDEVRVYAGVKPEQGNNDDGKNPGGLPGGGGVTNPSDFSRNLEVPKLKGGNSLFITHTLDNGDVNYSVEWDKEKKSNRWSCWTLTKKNTEDNVKRAKSDRFAFDPMLPVGSYLEVLNFGRGFDRGHLCPSGDRKSSRQANDQTFYMSNMQPQYSYFNQHVWQAMENWTRENFKEELHSCSDAVLYICRGGTIDNPSYLLKNFKGLLVPKYFFAAQLLQYKERGQGQWKYKAIGFWYENVPNKDADTTLKIHVVSIKDLQDRTNIDFFCNLPDDIENKVENVSRDQVLSSWQLPN